jgi:hypothetical protein
MGFEKSRKLPMMVSLSKKKEENQIYPPLPPAGEGRSRSALNKSENAGCRKAAGEGGYNFPPHLYPLPRGRGNNVEDLLFQ